MPEAKRVTKSKLTFRKREKKVLKKKKLAKTEKTKNNVAVVNLDGN